MNEARHSRAAAREKTSEQADSGLGFATCQLCILLDTDLDVSLLEVDHSHVP